MRAKCVCLYWLNKDFNEFRNGDQDSDKIPDRVDRDSYHGHGKTRAADHPQPAPGSRADEHYNCEYFATNFWKAFVETVGQDGGKCWIIHYAGHATVAWSYKGEFVIEEPQGGSPYFSKIPALVERNMPDRGQRATVGGAQVYNMPVNHWLAKTGEWNQSIDYNWKPSLWNEAK